MRNRMFLLLKAELADCRTRILLLVGLPLLIIINNLTYSLALYGVIEYNVAVDIIVIIFVIPIFIIASSAFIDYHNPRISSIIMLPMSKSSKFIYGLLIYVVLSVVVFVIIFYGSYLLWQPILGVEERFLNVNWLNLWEYNVLLLIAFFASGIFIRRFQFVYALAVIFYVGTILVHYDVIWVIYDTAIPLLLSVLLMVATWVSFNRKQIK